MWCIRVHVCNVFPLFLKLEAHPKGSCRPHPTLETAPGQPSLNLLYYMNEHEINLMEKTLLGL